MRTLIFALTAVVSAIFTSAAANAKDLKGYWRMDDPLEAMQAVLEVYTCRGERTLCGKIAAVVGPGIDRSAYLNSELLRGFTAQRDGTFKGKLKMPVGRLPARKAVVEPRSQNSLRFEACFFGQCRSGTMSRLD